MTTRPTDRRFAEQKLGVPNITVHPAPPSLRATRTLAQLAPGQVGRITRVNENGNPELAARILEIGMVRGTTVQHLRAAPLGDPIEVDVEGFLLCLRRNEAEAVIVETN